MQRPLRELQGTPNEPIPLRALSDDVLAACVTG
jgi:hypothetical protein